MVLDQKKIMASAPVKWEAMADAAGAGPDAEMAARAILDDAIWKIRAGAYFNARSLGLKHREAVKSANSMVAKCRKAMGYSYPKDELNF